MRNSGLLATLIGFSAVLMWSTLAVLTAASGRVPPLQLMAMTFATGGLIGVVWLASRRELGALRQAPAVWLHGVGGLFGYHFLYFTALRGAPPAEAGLVNYLWPLLIVLFSAALPGERLRWFHVAGAVLGLAGTATILVGGAGLAAEPRYLPGYAAALGAAGIWAIYSVLAGGFFRRVPSGAVAGFCLATAALSVPAHLLFETTVWPAGLGQWLAVIALGVLPTGLAFYVWDFGLKRGDVRVLGASSYAAPLLSTALLVLAGHAVAGPGLALAALLIAGGGMLAASGIVFRRRATAQP